MFGSIGFPELILVFIVVLLVFGPNKLPEFARLLGKTLREFRSTIDNAKSAIEDEIYKEGMAGNLKDIGKDVREALNISGDIGKDVKDALGISGDIGKDVKDALGISGDIGKDVKDALDITGGMRRELKDALDIYGNIDEHGDRESEKKDDQKKS